MSITQIRSLFFLAAMYDGLLGLVALLFARPVYQWFGVEPPNHAGYVQFPALLLLIFAAMFVRIARDPVGAAAMIPYGVGLKVAYCAVTFWHQLTGTIPSMWLPWAWADLGFLMLFILAQRSLSPSSRPSASTAAP
jgi:hypothetical protein